MIKKVFEVDKKLEELEKVVSTRSGIRLDSLDSIDIETANKEELLLKILNQLKSWFF